MASKVAERKTQVYFPEELHRQLKEYAKQQGVSMAEVIRQATTQLLLSQSHPPEDSEHDPIHGIVGMIKGAGVTDASQDHDRYIYGQLLERKRHNKGHKHA